MPLPGVTNVGRCNYPQAPEGKRVLVTSWDPLTFSGTSTEVFGWIG